MQKLKVAVLISGRGSNLQALIEACSDKNFPAEIILVISNKSNAQGLQRAHDGGIKTCVINHKSFNSREDFDREMDKQIKQAGAEFVCMAGFMRLLSEWFVAQWHNKLINIHPSLLPSFKGLDAQKQALEYGVKYAGCTVHFVRNEMDVGPIITQEIVPVHDNDDVAKLSERILTVEHKAYVRALRLIAEGRVVIKEERVYMSSSPCAGIS